MTSFTDILIQISHVQHSRLLLHCFTTLHNERTYDYAPPCMAAFEKECTIFLALKIVPHMYCERKDIAVTAVCMIYASPYVSACWGIWAAMWNVLSSPHARTQDIREPVHTHYIFVRRYASVMVVYEMFFSGVNIDFS